MLLHKFVKRLVPASRIAGRMVRETILLYSVELQWLQHLWYHENMFETGIVRANEINHSARPGGIIGIFFRFSLT